MDLSLVLSFSAFIKSWQILTFARPAHPHTSLIISHDGEKMNSFYRGIQHRGYHCCLAQTFPVIPVPV